jgi:hypothetical protein
VQHDKRSLALHEVTRYLFSVRNFVRGQVQNIVMDLKCNAKIEAMSRALLT